jgi:hypothetical protein
MPTPEEIIESNLAKPESASADGVSATQHNLKDQIAAAEYVSEKNASNRKKLPIRFAKLRPDGAA